MDSRRLGYLVIGEEIVCLGTEMSGDVPRVQFDRGWASVFWMGKQMLEPLADDTTDQTHPESDGEDELDEPGTPPRTKSANDRRSQREFELQKQRVLNFPLFRDLDRTYIDNIVRMLETRTVEPGTVVIEKGKVGEQEMYFVAKGTLNVLMSLDQRPFAKVRVGKYFGESSLVDGAVRNAYVKASSKKAVALDVLPKHRLSEALRNAPELEQYVGDGIKQLKEQQRAEHEKRIRDAQEGATRVLELIYFSSSSDDDDDPIWEDEVTSMAAQ